MSGFCKDSRLARPARLVADEVDNDAKISEFFELASSGDPPPYFASPDLFSLSSLAQYPPELRLHHVSASNCASYGYLPLISRFYAIIDNRLFLWRANRRTFSEQTTVEEKVITCVCAFKGAKDFFAKRVKTLLAIATPTYINVHIIEDDVIKFDTFYTVSTTFVPMVMCPGNPNELLIGGSDGGVHLFHFLPRVEGGMTWLLGASEPTFELKTNSKRLSLGSASPVRGLWFDASTGFVAALSSTQDSQSLKFWKLVEGSLSSAGMAFHVPKGIRFVSVSPVPLCESEHIRFVAFASDGTRYYFGTTAWFFGLWTRVNLRGKRERPVELNDETVVGGFYSLGFYAFVTKGNLCVIRSKSVDGGYELVGGTSLPGTGLDVIGFGEFGLKFLATQMYHEPGVWQHFESPPKAIVMTSEGTCQLVFEPPVAELRRLLVESSGAYSEPVKGFMEINEGSGAAAILLADMWPELRAKAIHVAYTFMREKMTDTGDEPNPETLTFVTQSFYLRVARILALGWQQPVFERNADQQLLISYVFRNAQTRMLDQLQNIKGVIDEYKSFSATNRPYGDREEVIMDIEHRQLNQLNSFVDFCVEILKLITILSRQKALLTNNFALMKLDEHTLARLESSKFFDSEAKVPLDEALRTFVMQLYMAARDDPSLDFLAAQIGKQCPTFSQIADAQIAEAMDNVELATRMDEDYRGDLLRESVSVLLEFIDRRKINIRKICAMLFEVEEYARAIDLVCARVAAIDDVEQGFYWWRNGCDDTDETGKEAFLKDYDCYEAVFQAVHTPEGLKAIEEKDNQFLHIVIFDKLLKSNDLTLLFSIKSKYLEPYIRDSNDWNVRELLYKLYIGKREYEKATRELLKIASDAEGFSLAQRIEWLETARTTGIQAHRKDLVDEAKVRLDCAKIQKKLSAIDSDCILGLQELLAEAKKEKQWGICLEILNLQPPAKDPEMSMEITNMWLNFLTDSGRGDDHIETEEEINTRVGRFLHALPPTSEILSPEYLVPAFEDTRHQLGLKPIWVVSFLTTICVSGTKLFDAYCDFILEYLPADIARDRRNQLVYAAIWLLRTYRGDFGRLADIVKEIVNDEASPYRREILAVVDSLVNDAEHGAADKNATLSEKLAILS